MKWLATSYSNHSDRSQLIAIIFCFLYIWTGKKPTDRYYIKVYIMWVFVSPYVQNKPSRFFRLFHMNPYSYSGHKTSTNPPPPQSHTRSFYLSLLCTSLYYIIIFLGRFYNCITLSLRLRWVHYFFVPVALICFVIYLTKIFLLKICKLSCPIK